MEPSDYLVERDSPPLRERHSDYWRLLPRIGLLYLAFGILFGLIQGGLPPLLRTRGLDIGRLGWLFLLLLPFGMTFLWAPWVDRWRLPWLSHRSGWIVAMQGVAIAGVTLIAFGQQLPPILLLGIGLVVALAAATMDLALDALVTETTPSESRSLAGAIKVGALSIGAMTGGGVFLALFQSLGWRTIFLLIVLLLVIATVPLLSWRSERHEPSSNHQASLLAALRQPLMRRRLMLLSLVSCVLIGLFSLNRVMLVDLGLPLERVGWVVGTLSPLCSLGAAIVAPLLLRRFNLAPCLALFCLLGMASALLMFVGTWQASISLALVGAVSVNAGVSGLYVVICSIILGWASNLQAATDYAALYGISRLLSLVVLMTVMQGLSRIGWPLFYAIGLAGLPLVVILLARACKESGPPAASLDR
ncbi:MFS transporter [Azorhizophilus paspali]|uniref:MFS transporter n=1 Tax=Azorhizophilus paspali TaxID=69963 RepID=A0ABV6SJ91_AZOPA